MSQRLGFRHVEAIRATMQTGSVTGAANRLHVTQPAVSNILRDAEARLGFALFERIAGRNQPTRKAVLLMAEIDRAFIGLDAINEVCQRLRHSVDHRITIAATPAFSASVLPQVIRRFRSHYPNVTFSLISQNSNLVQSMVMARKADIGFGLSVGDIPGMRRETMLNPRLYCVVSACHPLAEHGSVSAEDLLGYEKIDFQHLYEGTQDTHSPLFDRFTSKPEVVVDSATALTVCALVEAGVGFALAHSTAIHMFRHSKIRAIPFEPATYADQLCAYLLNSDDQQEKLTLLIKMVKEQAEAVEQGVFNLGRK